MAGVASGLLLLVILALILPQSPAKVDDPPQPANPKGSASLSRPAAPSVARSNVERRTDQSSPSLPTVRTVDSLFLPPVARHFDVVRQSEAMLAAAKRGDAQAALSVYFVLTSCANSFTPAPAVGSGAIETDGCHVFPQAVISDRRQFLMIAAERGRADAQLQFALVTEHDVHRIMAMGQSAPPELRDAWGKSVDWLRGLAEAGIVEGAYYYALTRINSPDRNNDPVTAYAYLLALKRSGAADAVDNLLLSEAKSRLRTSDITQAETLAQIIIDGKWRGR